MARIRSVKPEIRRSLTVGGWPREVRLAFIYLWMYLDDDGRGHDDLRLIRSELFPLDDDVTVRKLDRWLTAMATDKNPENEWPPLCRYETAGRRYLHAVYWHEHQRINRPQPSALPACPIHEDSLNGHGVITDDSLNDQGARTEPSPPSRAPAEQGAGKGTGSKERGGAKPEPESDATHTQQLIDEHLDALERPPSDGTVRQTRATVAGLLRDGRDPADVAAGLARMRERNLSLSKLPTLVDEAIPAKPPAGVPPRPPKCDDCDPNRMLVDDDGVPLRRCPNCHPLETTQAAAT